MIFLKSSSEVGFHVNLGLVRGLEWKHTLAGRGYQWKIPLSKAARILYSMFQNDEVPLAGWLWSLHAWFRVCYFATCTFQTAHIFLLTLESHTEEKITTAEDTYTSHDFGNSPLLRTCLLLSKFSLHLTVPHDI